MDGGDRWGAVIVKAMVRCCTEARQGPIQAGSREGAGGSREKQVSEHENVFEGCCIPSM